MNRSLLLPSVIEVLNRAGFVTSERCDVRPRSFDIVASKDNKTLLLKVLSNIDALSQEMAEELKRITRYLLASPLVIGERMKGRFLETGVLYRRYGIPSMNVQTLYDYLVEGIKIFVYSERGGLYVKIDGSVLRRARLRMNLSIGDLSKMIGVSRRSISRYEEDLMETTVANAIELQEILGEDILTPLDPLSTDASVKSRDVSDSDLEALHLMARIGFEVHPTRQAPFDAISEDERSRKILTAAGKRVSRVVKRAKIMSSISDVTGTMSVIILEEGSKEESIENTAIVEEREVEKISDTSEFLDLLRSRTGISR
ncbi:MAG TPA: transcriptional regulator [Candidatus Syntrophoarchaeum butanivorans]|uniref:Putative HTH-type transcriptional regulatory protein ENG09_02135 n=1 Tax=Candidatus Syntropharchaeum butanivorans TaxID=1839936 RepID=A0A1F2P5A8_9EURY|nr:MAG: transcriptional regulator [Candidatus Syntrophoarchaeum butanivorans]RJS71208.1 MAG: transcriptional regulator [Candidatus Syntrophoarchaeum sp. WYZ-LMO15]HDM36042.1 transcriptional regulator [Candidatus Syntrophoarchaeum butanivorans]HEC56400.1 transcriptional regulator [Candidatus Syntrophoarchaeum butanivorans]